MTKRLATETRRTRVAVVDDYQLVMDALSAHLARGEHAIDVVIGAMSWAELVAHPQFPADVTVLDLNLKDGLNLATKIQALRTAGIEVVDISRNTDASSISRALQAGASGFVPKTDPATDLVAAIHAAARGEQYLRAPLAAEVAAINTDFPGLGEREHQALSLYSTGRSIRQVAVDMNTTEETIKSYIKRARRKYRDAGIELGTRVLLRQHGVRQGWVDPD